MSTLYPNPSYCWVRGNFLRRLDRMQLLMRRPEITGFVPSRPRPIFMISLSSRPAGIGIVRARNKGSGRSRSRRAEAGSTAFPPKRASKITYTKIDGANHFFDKPNGDVVDVVEEYVKGGMALD
jgi:alpha/beta superfamily hydrolase